MTEKTKEYIPRLNEWEQKMINYEETLQKEGVLDAAQAIILAEPQANVYLVGGSVRDMLLGRGNKDYDFVVTGVEQGRLMTILAQSGKTERTGSSFGVIKNTPTYQYLIASGQSGLAEPFDFALPRQDQESGSGGHHDTIVTVDAHIPMEDDLLRRDLTINSLAWDLLNKCFVYPRGKEEICQSDLKNKIIRTVDAPEKSFGGDWLRMLRAIRFSCQLEGFELSPETLAAIQGLSWRINEGYEQDVYDKNFFDEQTGAKRKKLLHKVGEYKIARERVAEELLKALAANPLKALDLYDQSGFLEQLLPELHQLKGVEQPSDRHGEGDAYAHTRLALAQTNEPEFLRYAQIIDELFPNEGQPANNNDLTEKIELYCAILFHDLGKLDTREFNEEKKRITFYGHDKVSVEKARVLANRLCLGKPTKYKINLDNLGKIIGEHMFFFADFDHVSRKTIYEKFLANNDRAVVRNQFKLVVADILASRPASTGQPDFSSLEKLLEIIRAMKADGQEKINPLLDGKEIMEILGWGKGGPLIGKIKEALLVSQLNGFISDKREAEKFVLSFAENHKTT